MPFSNVGALMPSELVLLRGEQFVPKGNLFDKVKLLQGNQEVSGKALARMVFAIAVLANEQAGTLRLQEGARKAMLGVAQVAAVRLEVISKNDLCLAACYSPTSDPTTVSPHTQLVGRERPSEAIFAQVVSG